MEVKASLETLPLELQEEIFGYVYGEGPRVNIIIRDAGILQEEDHFNILPKNPPHEFARRTCSPPHNKQVLPSIARRRECYDPKHEILENVSPVIHRFGLSVIYQISPIPTNLICLSKTLHTVISGIWARLRKPIKRILDEHIIVKGKHNFRFCGSYEIIWYTDFLEGKYSPEAEDLFRNRCRFIFDFGLNQSFYATQNTMTPLMKPRVKSIVLTQETAVEPSSIRSAFQNLETIGVILKGDRKPPSWALLILAQARGNDINNCEDSIRLELLRSGSEEEISKGTKEVSFPILTGAALKNKLYLPFLQHQMSEAEAHDRGRYVYNVFRKDGDCFFQGRETAEAVVSTVSIEGKTRRELRRLCRYMG